MIFFYYFFSWICFQIICEKFCFIIVVRDELKNSHLWQSCNYSCYWILIVYFLYRYFAITRPLAYAVKRSVRLALIMIGVVWLVSALITCPPIFGWNDRNQNSTDCEYIADQGYVVYSALGMRFLSFQQHSVKNY